jgi:hypothetical protein
MAPMKRSLFHFLRMGRRLILFRVIMVFLFVVNLFLGCKDEDDDDDEPTYTLYGSYMVPLKQGHEDTVGQDDGPFYDSESADVVEGEWDAPGPTDEPSDF